jgi:DNA modification methylase
MEMNNELILYQNKVGIKQIEGEIITCDDPVKLSKVIIPKLSGFMELCEKAGMLSLEDKNKMSAMKLKAELQLAKLLDGLERAKNQYDKTAPDIVSGASEYSETLKACGINEREAQRIQEFVELDFNDIDEMEQEANKETVRLTKKKLVEKAKTKKVKYIKREKEKKQKLKIVSTTDLYNQDFFDFEPDKKIDLILTDPPYGSDYLKQWTKLAEWSKKHLKKNGFLISYFGELNLPQFYFELSKHLNYYWTFCLVHSGNKQLINPRNIFCGWKPIVVYQNKFKKLDIAVEDIIIGTGREKGEHEWQQAEDEIESIINNFSDPGDLICDPFMGSGTILKKSKKMNRNILGFEIDKSRYEEGVIKING